MDHINQVLQLPERCLVNRKITKAFFKRNFVLTVAERSLLELQISQIFWVASLNPDNSNIPAFQKEEEIYEEVQVIIVTTTLENFATIHFKVAELIQKHIPYAILLCITSGDQTVWSTYQKRVSQTDATRRIIHQRFFTQIIPAAPTNVLEQQFLESLSYGRLNKGNLQELYASYTACIIALQAAAMNGLFVVRTADRTREAMQSLARISLLGQEINSLSRTAQKETQLNRRVSFNLQIQAKRAEIIILKEALKA